MSKLTAILEGITVQHAGELIFNTGSTVAERRTSRLVYLYALEDFAFAYVFGGEIAVSKNLPKVGDDTPGRHLLSELPERLIIDVDTKVLKFSPRDMLARQIDKDILIRSIAELHKIVPKDLDVWRQFIIREARSYLGDNPTLRSADISPDDYVFAKRSHEGREEDYHMKDRSVEDQLNKSVVKTLVDAIITAGAQANAERNALSEFVRRTILTHLQIYLWYRRAATAATKIADRLRIPYPTRASLETFSSEYQRVRKNILPNALRFVLTKARTRREFLEELKDLRNRPWLEEIRRDLAEAQRSAAKGDVKISEEIERKIEDATTRIAKEVVQTIVKGVQVTAGILPSATGGVAHERSERELPSESWAQLVRGPLLPYGARDYMEELARIFPELAPDE